MSIITYSRFKRLLTSHIHELAGETETAHGEVCVHTLMYLPDLDYKKIKHLSHSLSVYS